MLWAHPRVGDGLYDCLPFSVYTLTLSYCPHKFQRRWLKHSFQQYDFRTLTSSEMSGVLRRPRLPSQIQLELDYNADAGKRNMLRCLSVAFSHLRRPTLIRYRLEGETDGVIMDVAASSLARCTHLQTVTLCLDLSTTPLPNAN
ncbi:hypothetical protein BD309DRAFT_356265 [Dichomitus squalens]|nr:hypothetical protein BD309DRAFT_356265 [Dichomitus squalens]